MSARRVVFAACAAATLLWASGAWGLYRDYFPSGADGSMDTDYGAAGYSINGWNTVPPLVGPEISLSDKDFGFVGFTEFSDGPDGVPRGYPGDTNDGVLLSDWIVGKKVVSAKLYIRDFEIGFCDASYPPGTYLNDPVTIIGFRLANEGPFTDRRADGTGIISGPLGAAPYSAPAVDGGMNTPVAWRIGVPPYTQDGHIGSAGLVGGVPVTPEFYRLSVLDSANPGAEVKAANSFFDADGDGFEGASGPINGPDTELTDGMYAYEYIIRHSDALVVNSQTLDAADCTGYYGSEEPRDAAQDGNGVFGWYAVPLDPCLAKLLGSDPEMKGLTFSSIGQPGALSPRFGTRDLDLMPFLPIDVFAPYLDVSATLAGDVSNDGFVDIFDVIDTVTAFGTAPGEPLWNAEADFDCSGTVDIFDVIDAVLNFGQSAP